MYRISRNVVYLTIVGLLQATPSISHAQGLQPVTVLVGVSLSGVRTRHPDGGILGAGALLGVERRLHQGASIRAIATADRNVFTSDDIALCHPIPGGCLPDAVFPTWLYGLRVEGSVTPRDNWPLRLVAGVGAIYATKFRENERNASYLALDSVLRASWRVGLELPLGASRRAPIVQLTRTGFGAEPYSVSAVDAVSIMIRP